MPGPPPKRSEERRRRNAPAAGEPTQLDVEALPGDDPDSLPFLIRQPVVVPEAGIDEDAENINGWHPLAVEFWESLKRSGQAVYWEPSDWMVAKLMCESISRDLKPQVVGISPASEYGPAEAVYEKIPLKGASLSAYLKAFGQLMLTEGERRRLALELERTRVPKADRGPAKVVEIKDRKRALAVAGKREVADG